MTEPYLSAQGELVAPAAMELPKAQALVSLLRDGDLPFVQFRECRRLVAPPLSEIVVFDVDVQLGQRRVHDIRRYERVAVQFWEQDDGPPETLALRGDFPSVPHLNLRVQEFPRSLCLFDEPWRELKLRWNPLWFVERIRTWLARTAAGTLHEEDQPLEPILFGSPWTLVLPFDLFTLEAQGEIPLLKFYPVPGGRHRATLLVQPGGDDAAGEGGASWVATTFRAAPQPHGIIRRNPETLHALHEFVSPGGIDLVPELRKRLLQWHQRQNHVLDAHLLLVLLLPKTRATMAAVEEVEVRAFLTMQSVREIGEQLGVWAVQDGQLGLLMLVEESKCGQELNIMMANCTYECTRAWAASLNGLEADTTNIMAIGVGALGSHVFMNLVRAGFGRWTLIDDDFLQPHNLARHELNGFAVGLPKADALAHQANATIRGETVAQAIVTNLLDPSDATDVVQEATREAQILLDMSASVAVGRYLARDVDSAARRVSLFLNPSGRDLILLAEDVQRHYTLDMLEMQYYRQLITEPALENHLARPPERLRYAQSCRDLSSTIPHELVALHAAVGSRALRRAVASEAACLAIWQAEPNDLTVSRIAAVPFQTVEQSVGDWTLCTDQGLLEKLAKQRIARLPNETGGILIGAFDMERRIVYLADTVPSPPDSVEWPTSYIRGHQNLSHRVREIESRTDGMLRYVGEWHSHPDQCSCAPSPADRTAFTWLAEVMGREGLPPLMVIVCEGGQYACYLGTMDVLDPSHLTPTPTPNGDPS